MIFCGRGSCLLLLGLLLPGNGPAAVAGGAFRDDADYLRRKFREDVTDRSTGLGLPELKREARQVAEDLRGREPWCVVKARMFERICDRMSIGVSAHDFFRLLV